MSKEKITPTVLNEANCEMGDLNIKFRDYLKRHKVVYEGRKYGMSINIRYIAILDISDEFVIREEDTFNNKYSSIELTPAEFDFEINGVVIEPFDVLKGFLISNSVLPEDTNNYVIMEVYVDIEYEDTTQNTYGLTFGMS